MIKFYRKNLLSDAEFDAKLPHEEKIAALVCFHYFDKAEYKIYEKQKVGIATDATIQNPSETKCEIKHDIKSRETGNIFIELFQTFDCKKTWIPSGLTLAAQQSDVFISMGYLDGDKETRPLEAFIALFNPGKLLQVIQEYVLPSKYMVTKAGSNGNKSNQFTKGVIIPINKKVKYGIGSFNSFEELYEKTRWGEVSYDLR